MPPKTRDETEPQSPAEQAAQAAQAEQEQAGQQAAEQTDKNKGSYVVTADVVTMRVGPKAEHVQRFRRGQVIRPDTKYVEQDWIDRLVRLRGIKANDGKPLVRTTARVASRAAGAMDDPVPVPDPAFVPVDLDAVPTVEQDGEKVPAHTWPT